MSDITIFAPPVAVSDDSPEDFNRSVREIFKRLYNSDPDFRSKATSQKDNAVEGHVNADKYAVADTIRKYASDSEEFPEVAAATLERINRSAGYAARRLKVSRTQIAAAREQWALEQRQQTAPRDSGYLAG